VVAGGDSLSRISQRYYGTPNRWQEIYNANRDKLGNEGVLRIGTELRIP
jgi:nucleoid-associated protein YgaU